MFVGSCGTAQCENINRKYFFTKAKQKLASYSQPFKFFLYICQTDSDLRVPVYHSSHREKHTLQNKLNFAAGG